MKRQEIQEVFSLLAQSRLRPQLCNAFVHLSNCPVRCGHPTTPGDDSDGSYVMLPEELLSRQPELFVPAKGDSMADAGFEEGDLLRVRLNTAVHDGDIVVASVDGGATVKVIFTDESGGRWLVPLNERYDAILLTQDNDVRILGTVVGVEKQVVRASSADCLKAIRRTKERHRQQEKPSDRQVDAAIVAVAGEVSNGRQWYAVYRTMADHGVMDNGCYGEFCRRVSQVVPTHHHLPVAKELGRLAVQSFRKRVGLWNSDDAPVSGTRLADYLRIARITGEQLAGAHT